ncbi:Y-e3.2 family protein [Megaselia abdita]
MLWRILSIFALISLTTFAVCQRQTLCEVLTRSQITYVLTDEQKQQLVSQGYNLSQNPYNGIYKFVVDPRDTRIYVNMPRIFTTNGMAPYTLGVQESFEPDAPIYPFPSFEENQLPNGMVSAVSTTLDNCNQMWILDGGTFSLSETVQKYDVALLIYSFKEKRIIYRYPFPREFTTPGPSSSARLIIDDSQGCENIKIIVSDALVNHLAVFDYKTKTSWKIKHWTFEPLPQYSSFQYKNHTLLLPVGIYSINLTPPMGKRGIRYLMYNSYSGDTIYTVPLSILYRRELWTRGVSVWRPYGKHFFVNKNQKGNQLFNKVKNFFKNEEEPEDQYTFIDVNRYFKAVGKSESLVGSYCNMDIGNRILYCALPRERGVSAWFIDKPFSTNKIIVRNNELLQNPAVVATKTNLQGETEIVITTTNFVQIALGMMFPDPGNYAVFICKASEIHQGDHKPCTSNIYSHCKTVGF